MRKCAPMGRGLEWRTVVFVSLILMSLNSCGLQAKISKPKLNIDFDAVSSNLKEATEFAGTFAEGISSNNVETVVGAVLNIASNLPGPIGAIFAGASFLFGLFTGAKQTEDPHTALLKEVFKRLDAKLDRLAANIKEQIFDLKTEIRSRKLHETAETLNIIQEIFENSVNQSDGLEVQRLRRSCEKHTVYEKVIYLKDMIATNEEASLKYLLLQEGDRNNYLHFVRNVFGMFYQALVVQSLCVAATNPDTDPEKLKEYSKNDVTRAQRYLNLMGEQVKEDDKVLKGVFFPKAISMIEKFLYEKEKLSNNDFANALFKKLKKEYSFRLWCVSAYGDGSTYGSDVHLADPDIDNKNVENVTDRGSSYFRTFIRKNGRNLVIASPNVQNGKYARLDLYQCMANFEAGEDCRKLIKNTKSCATKKNLQYVALYCFTARGKTLFDGEGAITVTRGQTVMAAYF